MNAYRQVAKTVDVDEAYIQADVEYEQCLIGNVDDSKTDFVFMRL